MNRVSTMRAARIVSRAEVVCERVPIPEPSARQVRYRIEGCGVSSAASRLEDAAQGLAAGEPGSESWGIVDAVGSEVHELQVGDRIASFAERGFAEYGVADLAAVVKLPAELSGVPFPAPPLARVMEVFERSKIVAGQLIAVVGVGFLGAALIQLAKLAGARVVAISRRSFSLTIAREMGASILIELNRPSDTAQRVLEQCAGQTCHVAIDAAGNADALSLASELVGPSGTVVIAGCHSSACNVDVRLWSERGIDVLSPFLGSNEARTAAALGASQAMRAGGLDLSSLYTHELPLERLAEALELARARPLGFVKAVVRP
jgi:threonine dehydrogenase-like Zn-dependent dehydrogenase